MKPIIIFEFEGDAYDPEKAEQFDKYLSSQSIRNEYDMLVLWGGRAKVYYPCKSLKYYYHKLRIWLIRRTMKKK